MVRISEKHGLNPTIPICYFCNEEKNEVMLLGKLPGDAEAPMSAVWNTIPCDNCKKLMEQGVILISVKDGEKGDNPYRTGGWVVLKEEAIKNIFGENCEALKTRMAFLYDEAWDAIGLPRPVLVK